MVRRTAAPLLAVLAACAAPQHPWSGETLCELPGAAEPRPETWFALLLRGYDPQSGLVTSPAVDCTGSQVKWDSPAAACFDDALHKTLLPVRRLGEKDVVRSQIGPDLQLVWVVTNRHASGDGLGPVAVVESTGGRWVVRAIGALRANAQEATLRLEKLGDLELVAAEGASCMGADRASCQRAARVLPLRGLRFAGEPLFSEAGDCLSPAWFDLTREESERLGSGWRRTYKLTASLRFEPAAIRVEELLVVHDADPREPATPPRLFRRAEGERSVRLVEGKLVVSGRSLWDKLVRDRAAP